jgi:hypothetical protein
MPHVQSPDTSPAAEAVQFELWRRMTPVEKVDLFTGLTLAVQELAMAGMRLRYPNESDDTIRLRLAVQRLGEETVRRVWHWQP